MNSRVEKALAELISAVIASRPVVSAGEQWAIENDLDLAYHIAQRNARSEEEQFVTGL